MSDIRTYPCGDCLMEYVCPYAYSDRSCSVDASDNKPFDVKGGES